jgi:hypothetical protein
MMYVKRRNKAGATILCITPIAKSKDKINVLQTMTYNKPSGGISTHEK